MVTIADYDDVNVLVVLNHIYEVSKQGLITFGMVTVRIHDVISKTDALTWLEVVAQAKKDLVKDDGIDIDVFISRFVFSPKTRARKACSYDYNAVYTFYDNVNVKDVVLEIVEVLVIKERIVGSLIVAVKID